MERKMKTAVMTGTGKMAFEQRDIPEPHDIFEFDDIQNAMDKSVSDKADIVKRSSGYHKIPVKLS